MSERVVIVSAVRTPIGSFRGALSTLKAHELGAVVIREALARCHIPAGEVSEVILGQVLTAGQGQNPARQAAVLAGLPKEVPAYLVNLLCGSSLKAVALAVQSIKCGDASIVVAGGQESMSQAQHSAHVRGGAHLGELALRDSLLQDGLTDAFHSCHMGITAENVARRWNVDRKSQDAYAFKSQQDTKNSVLNNFFGSELIPVSVPGKTGDLVVLKDEFPRPDTTLEGLARLEPAFLKDGTGTVTVGNATGMNDGAAAVVLTSASVAASRGLQPLAEVVSYAVEGMDADVMGVGPVLAVQSALRKANWKLEDVDLFELNEPYAASSIAVIQDLGVDPQKVNIRGGAIALGHPLGSSGARVLVTLIYALRQTGKQRGVASLCIGGGMGIAMCIQVN